MRDLGQRVVNEQTKPQAFLPPDASEQEAEVPAGAPAQEAPEEAQ